MTWLLEALRLVLAMVVAAEVLILMVEVLT